MINSELNQKIHYYLTCFLAFFIPVHPKVLPPVIILLVLNWILIPSNIKKSFDVLKQNLSLSATAVLYIAYLVGMLYSTNYKFGGRVLETMLSFILLPLIYSAFINITKEKLVFFIKLFVLGAFTYSVICFSYATYAYFLPLEIDLGNGFSYNFGANYFYYYYLSVFFHPSYTAMYSVFALSAIVLGLKTEKIKINVSLSLIIIVLTLFVLMLSSKAGWITLFLLLIYTLFQLISKSKIITTLLIVIPLATGFLVLNVYYTPAVSHRIPQVEAIQKAVTEKDQNNTKVTTSTDGNASRIFIWKASAELFLENFIIGTGTGDAKDELLKKYIEKGMTTEYKNQLNSHNQYLNTSVSLGLIGLIILIGTFLLPFYQSITEKNTIATFFLILVSVNLLFESMYGTQAGVIFYAFINTLLCSTFVKIKTQ